MIQLQAQIRTIFKKAVASLLKQDIIPAEIYGHKFENKHISVSRKEFTKVFNEAGETGIVTIALDGKNYPVLVHSVEFNHLTDAIVHIDFYAVNMNEKTTAEIPLHLIGEAPAVKELGGVLVKALEKIEVEAFPADLVPHIDVDISKLTELNQSIHIKDLQVSAKIKVLSEPSTVIVVVSEPKVEEEPVVAPVVEEAAPATAETAPVTEEKK
jgi:large subunit ribosomal protein L25